MRQIAFFAMTALMGVLVLAAGGSSAADLDEMMSYDGLQKTQVKGVELAYVLPGASLAGYRSIQLDPVYVAFQKDWNPTVVGSNMRIGAKDREAVRTRAAKLVYEAFVKELQGKGGYPIVSVAGPDVLRVKLNVINLIVSAPDVQTAGMNATFVASAGQATLYAELYDSESGAVIARVVDTRAARDSGMMSLGGGVSNTAEGQEIAGRWAKILRNGLDKARQQAVVPVKVAH